MELRPYQQDCINKIRWSLSNLAEGNDIVVLPTGAGKSLIIAHLAKDLDQPILTLQPSKEILEQNYKKLCLYVDPSEAGIYSASMNEKTIGRYTFATIQSIYKNPSDFRHFRLVIIDECHLVNPKNNWGMFTSFLKAIDNPKVIGLTATPYRQDQMWIDWGLPTCKVVASVKLINRMKGQFWNRIIFNINTAELMEQGYLAPLEYIDMSVVKQENIPLNKSRSDFDLEKYEKMLTDKQSQIMGAIQYAANVSKSVLVFCSSVAQAEKFAGITPNSAFVTGKTPAKERDAVINGFKDGSIQTVFNVGVLTTGFDHPALDCIVLVRPTRSISLYYQMLGRGVRLAEGKTSCRVIDLTSTVQNIGRVETIRLERQDKWELLSEMGSWHGRELYSFKVKKFA